MYFALKIKAMQNEGLKCSNNPDVFVKEFHTDQNLERKLANVCTKPDVTYRHWKKVAEDNKDAQNQKYRWKEIQETVTKADFIKIVTDECSKFRQHESRVQTQYKEIRKVREISSK
jgi:hypothetical protein